MRTRWNADRFISHKPEASAKQDSWSAFGLNQRATSMALQACHCGDSRLAYTGKLNRGVVTSLGQQRTEPP